MTRQHLLCMPLMSTTVLSPYHPPCGPTCPPLSLYRRARDWVKGSMASGLILALLSGCGHPSRAPLPDPAVQSALAPGGTLRAAINLGNPILASHDAQGQPQGVSVDLARELARQTGLSLQLIPYPSAGQTVQAIRSGEVDLAFVAIDPLRAADIRYSAAYVVIEGAYLVRKDSPIQRLDQVDHPGIRVAVGAGSAYDLYLRRALKSASLVSAPTSPAVVDLFVAQGLEVAAGVRQQLQADAQRLPGLRLLDGRFMQIEQAMGVPRERVLAAQYVARFVEAMKASGFVAQALQRHGIDGATVAPAADPPR